MKINLKNKSSLLLGVNVNINENKLTISVDKLDLTCIQVTCNASNSDFVSGYKYSCARWHG